MFVFDITAGSTIIALHLRGGVLPFISIYSKDFGITQAKNILIFVAVNALAHTIGLAIQISVIFYST